MTTLLTGILGGVRVKSVQRGAVAFDAIGAGTSNGTITVNSVDTSKSILLTTCRPAYSGRNFAGLLGISHEVHQTTVFAGASLTNSTTISWQAGSAMNTVETGSGLLRWELIEFY